MNIRTAILVAALVSIPVLAAPQSLEVATVVGPASGRVDGTGPAARFADASGLAIDASGNLYVMDRSIRRVTPAGVVTTLVASISGFFPTFARDAAGNFYYTTFGAAITRVDPAGAATTIYPAGGATSILGAVGALAVDASGTLWAGDTKGLVRINADGTATRVAGGQNSGPSVAAVDGPPGTATFSGVDAIAFDGTGSVFVACPTHTIRKITPDGNTTTVAGVDLASGLTDGTGSAARFSQPSGLAFDGSGNLIIADSGNDRIRRMTPAGAVTTIAGAGASLPEDGPAASASFLNPQDVVFNAAGDLFIADLFTIRKLSGGVVTTLAGLVNPDPTVVTTDMTQIRGIALLPGALPVVTDSASHTIRRPLPAVSSAIWGAKGIAGSADGPARATARFGAAADIAFDSSGNAFVADGQLIRRIAPGGTVTTFAGKRQTGSPDVDGTGTMARFGGVGAMVIDGAGNLFVSGFCSIRKVTPAAVVTTLAGSGSCATVDGTGTAASFSAVEDLAIDGAGNLYVAENNVVRKVTPTGVVTTLAGSPGQRAHADGIGSAARFTGPRGIAVDGAGDVFAADTKTIRKITQGGAVTTIAGDPDWIFGISDGTGPAAKFGILGGLVLAPNGTLYASDIGAVRAITTAGAVTSISVPEITFPSRLAVDAAGTLYSMQGTVRTISPSGAVSIYLITNTEGSQDGSLLAVARFNAPSGVAVMPDGAFIVADTGNHTIRRIFNDAATTLAGSAGSIGTSDGTGSVARFNAPVGIAADRNGVIYVADTGNSLLRKITSGVVSTVSGPWSAPRGVAVAADGTVYVADTGNHVIRAISTGGTITTLAGTPGASGSADGAGAAARFSSPSGIAVAPDGTIYVADAGTHIVRAVSAGGVVTTVAGAAGTSGLKNGLGAAARFNAPEALAVDASGAVYIADTANGSVRRGLPAAATAPVITTQPADVTASLHDTLRLTCEAGGSPSPALQWEVKTGTIFARVKETDGISGVDSPVLTIVDAGSGQHGAKYRCQAYNGTGVAYSREATITMRVLTLSPNYANFAGTSPAGASSGPSTIDTPPQSIAVTWSGPGSPAWTVTADQPWVQLPSPGGSGTGSFTIAASPANLPFNAAGVAAGQATVTLSSPADPELRTTVQVRLRGYSTSQAPFGAFDTPAQNATGLQGSLAVTGWALDNIKVDRVEIWRDRVAGETTPVYSGGGPGNGKIFIATATIVPGARPDVEQIYSGTGLPHAAQGGWGYMLLTYGLWNQGNGTYTLYAFAFDGDGTASTLGTKTIGVDNANATKPFGTIDTPSYGGTVSGAITNFGWALTPGPCTITNPNVQVSIDSGPLTAVVYGDVRPDIAGAFPAYTNAAAAGGHSTLDTTTLTNGMHTIGWIVTDSCGRADGVGSRFFTVDNASSTAAPQTAASISNPSRDFALRRMGGVETETPESATDGRRVIRLGQAERIELQLPGSSPYVADGLPLGSSFDAAEGKFYWQPAAGFLGAYDLKFTTGLRTERVRVVVGPPIRMAIDTPRAGNVVSASGFTLAGWAVDLASLDGAGIDTLHVWAYPVGGGAPVFVGVAGSGGARPDVTRLYGPAFGGAGFTLNGTLAPGTYDLVVYAHSAASNTFEGAQTTRVVVR